MGMEHLSFDMHLDIVYVQYVRAELSYWCSFICGLPTLYFIHACLRAPNDDGKYTNKIAINHAENLVPPNKLESFATINNKFKGDGEWEIHDPKII